MAGGAGSVKLAREKQRNEHAFGASPPCPFSSVNVFPTEITALHRMKDESSQDSPFFH